MRRLAAALLLATATPAAAASLPVRLEDGATWTVTIERQRDRQRPDAPPEKAALRTVSEATWAKGSDTDRLTLTPRSAEAPGESAGRPDLQSLMGGAVVLDVDETLAPLRVRNWDEVRQGLEKAMESATADPAVRAELKGLLTRLSAEQASQAVSPGWGLVSLGQGVDLELGEESTYEDSLPNPLGGPPIASVGAFRLESYDKAGGRAVVLWNQTLDPKSASDSITQAVQAMAERLAPEKAEEARKALAGAKITREDACRYEIDIPTGLAVSTACTITMANTIQGQTMRNVDRWTITQTRPQTPAKTD